MTELAEPSTAPARPQRRTVAGVVVLALVLVVVGAAWVLKSRGGDATAPYADTASTGSLTICREGGEVTEGSTEEPLGDLVVAQSAASGVLAGTGRRASLFAFQPRQGVDPVEFSGQQLTAPSEYDETGHPAAEVAPTSTTLASFVGAYPAAWDGFVQLRLILTAPGTPAGQDAYDTADLRIDGTRWTLVRGGGGDCSAAEGTAHSTLGS